jgi:glycosyltransferase involved in cell wall biosynthesis
VKIALVCDWYRPRIGGIEQHLEGLAQRLTHAGHDVVVITPTRGDPVVNDVRVHRIDTPLAPHFEFLRSAAGIHAIGDALERERVDVAHSHVSIVSPAAIGGAVEAERRGIPSVVTFHSVVPRTAWLAHAMRVSLRTAEWNARFSAVSTRVAQEIAPAAGGRTVSILPNGVDAAFWRPDATARVLGPTAANGSSTNSIASLALFTGMRLNAKKRPLALVDIMSRLVDRLGVGTPVSLRIAGDGPQRDALQRAIDRARLADRIQLLGRCTHEQIRNELHAADVFLLPTIRESFGLAALEARCAGVPVVAMAQSGVAEVIEHGREGLLGRTDAELAELVATLAADRALREAIARHNACTPTTFDWPRVIDAHERIYREAMALRVNMRTSVRAEMNA